MTTEEIEKRKLHRTWFTWLSWMYYAYYLEQQEVKKWAQIQFGDKEDK